MATPVASDVKVVPPFDETEILTLPVTLKEFQVIGTVLPCVSVAPPAGAVTVRNAAGVSEDSAVPP